MLNQTGFDGKCIRPLFGRFVFVYGMGRSLSICEIYVFEDEEGQETTTLPENQILEEELREFQVQPRNLALGQRVTSNFLQEEDAKKIVHSGGLSCSAYSSGKNLWVSVFLNKRQIVHEILVVYQCKSIHIYLCFFALSNTNTFSEECRFYCKSRKSQ